MSTLPPVVDGIQRIDFKSWRQFVALIESGLPHAHEYCWRGHRRSDWLLEPTIDRDHRGKTREVMKAIQGTVIRQFQYAARGRRGPSPPVLHQNEWWALGQHFGLSTPLLDWTKSPFAAAYFAFAKTAPDDTNIRVIYGLHQTAVRRVNREQIKLAKLLGEDPRPSLLRIVEPLMDENARLVSQYGIFTKAPIGTTVEEWIERSFSERSEPVLVRISLPSRIRLDVLRSLNRMNINAASLFPDLGGAAAFVNMSNTISEY